MKHLERSPENLVELVKRFQRLEAIENMSNIESFNCISKLLLHAAVRPTARSGGPASEPASAPLCTPWLRIRRRQTLAKFGYVVADFFVKTSPFRDRYAKLRGPSNGLEDKS